MPYATDRDRYPHDLELCNPAFPVSPLNVFLTSQGPGVFDLAWDNPAALAGNSLFQVCGVNVYRSFDSEFGPFERITNLPQGATFYRDQTDNVLAFDERVEDEQWVLRGECTGSGLDEPRYVFKTTKYPIVQSGSQALPEQDINQVTVTVDGVEARVLGVIGETGEVEIDTRRHTNVTLQALDTLPVPLEGTDVRVSYRYNRSLLKTDLGTRVFYRVTTVGIPVDIPVITTDSLVETPLERAISISSRETEKTDWIWKEAVRRNRWIIQQGGERVKVFIRKTVGISCPCSQSYSQKQPLNDCLRCFGSGILDGYEGPYDIIIAPDDAERRINQSNTGRHVEHVYEVWTGPSPLLSQRDFVVKLNGERYSIGPVRMPSNRGMLLQQHFNIGFLDEGDVRYRVPLDGVQGLRVNEAGQPLPPYLKGAVGVEHNKPNIPDEREIRGRTLTFENITS